MSAADCTKDCTVDCGTCKGDPIGTLKRHIMRQLGFSRGAHGGVPFDRKDVWDDGYAEARRAVMRVILPRPGTVSVAGDSSTLRDRLIETMTAAVWPGGRWSAEAEVMLDSLLPVLAGAIRPHRWDKDYPDSAPEPCHTLTPDSFYAGILHAATVVRDLLEPVIRDASQTSTSVDEQPDASRPLPTAQSAAGAELLPEALNRPNSSKDAAGPYPSSALPSDGA